METLDIVITEAIDRYAKYFTNAGLKPILLKDIDVFKSIIQSFKIGTNYRLWVHLNSRNNEEGQIFGRQLSSFKFSYITIESNYKETIGGIKVYNVFDLGKLEFLNLIPYNIISATSLSLIDIEPTKAIAKYDYAIISALHKNEFQSLYEIIDKKTLKDLNDFEGSNTIKEALLKDSDKKVLIDFQERIGVVDATSLVTQIIYRYKPKYLIMVGVCAGNEKQDVKLKDIVIPETIYFREGKEKEGIIKNELGEESQVGYNYESINSPIPLTKISKIIKDKGKEILGKIKSAATHRDDFDNVKLHVGSHFCVNNVIKLDGYWEKLRSEYGTTFLSLEMESYGVARACELAGNITQPIIIKGVMDYANAQKGDTVKPDASHLAAQFAYYLIKDHLS